MRGDGRDRIVQRVRMRQAGDDDRRLHGEIVNPLGDLDAGARRRAADLGIDVVADDLEARRREIAREGAAHDAEPDDADRSF
jgi:hypothetical protein